MITHLSQIRVGFTPSPERQKYNDQFLPKYQHSWTVWELAAHYKLPTGTVSRRIMANKPITVYCETTVLLLNWRRW